MTLFHPHKYHNIFSRVTSDSKWIITVQELKRLTPSVVVALKIPLAMIARHSSFIHRTNGRETRRTKTITKWENQKTFLLRICKRGDSRISTEASD